MSNQQQQKNTTECCDRGYWEFILDHVEDLKGLISKFCKWILRKIESEWPEESGTTFFFWICSIVVDPFVLYVPRIDDNDKSLNFDRSFLGIISGLYIIISCLKIIIYLYNHQNIRLQPILWRIFVFGVPSVPILATGVLLVFLLYKPTSNIRASFFTFGMLFFLILYLVRILGVYRSFIATTLSKSAILRILNNLLLYFYGGHLFGGLWYFFAVWKKMRCWYTACKIHSECFYNDRQFLVTSGSFDFLDQTCFNTTNDPVYELGIFKDALLSHIVDTSNIGKKLLYCFRWGIQNLSGYGQSLGVSTHAWENIFVLVIAVYGMATFALFIGNMENLLKSSTAKSGGEEEETGRWTRESLMRWSPFTNLSAHDQNSIVEKCRRCNWPQSGTVNLKNLLTNLPTNIETEIKQIFFLRLLNNLHEFKGWKEESAKKLCEYAKPVVYEKNTVIVQNNSPIDEMIFVVEGKLEIKFYRNGYRRPAINHVGEDSFCGEELLPWFENLSESYELPTSNKTIKVLKQVHAFVVVLDDLLILKEEIKHPREPIEFDKSED